MKFIHKFYVGGHFLYWCFLMTPKYMWAVFRNIVRYVDPSGLV